MIKMIFSFALIVVLRSATDCKSSMSSKISAEPQCLAMHRLLTYSKGGVKCILWQQ